MDSITGAVGLPGQSHNGIWRRSGKTKKTPGSQASFCPILFDFRSNGSDGTGALTCINPAIAYLRRYIHQKSLLIGASYHNAGHHFRYRFPVGSMTIKAVALATGITAFWMRFLQSMGSCTLRTVTDYHMAGAIEANVAGRAAYLKFISTWCDFPAPGSGAPIGQRPFP
jgi:hypothetical protein